MTNIVSWNVNGIRAIAKKGFHEWMEKAKPDVLAIQETKAHPDQLSSELLEMKGYKAFWSSAEKKGYSGVAIYTKEEPVKVTTSLNKPEFDREGRVLCAEYKDFMLFNVYFPNGKARQERLDYKMDFYKHFLKHISKLKAQGKKIVVSGDYNTAHQAIDLARPKANEMISGFLPMERAWMDELVKAGFTDTFRHFDKSPEKYSWWSMRSAARERNVGWRIDYHFVSNNLLPQVTAASINNDVFGSDHCPVTIKLKR